MVNQEILEILQNGGKLFQIYMGCNIIYYYIDKTNIRRKLKHADFIMYKGLCNLDKINKYDDYDYKSYYWCIPNIRS